MESLLDDDIIFKKRNQSYGAYILRQYYNRNLIISTVLALIIFYATFIFAVSFNENIEEDYYDFSNVVFEYSALDFAPGDIPKAPENSKPPEKKIIISKTENLNDIKIINDSNVANDSTFNDISTADVDSSNGNSGGGLGSDTGVVFTRVHEIPMYPGGEDARKKFIKDHFNYANLGQNVKIEGVVWVSFIVEKDGSLSAIKVLNGIGAACDGEVVRVVKQMPRWTPGKRNGIPVRVILKMPIRFENVV